MNIGWIGLGAMGLPMANQLSASGFDVTGFDVREPTPGTFNGRFVSNLRDAVHNVDLVAVMVATPDQALDVLSGGLLDVAPGTVVVIHATVGVDCVSTISSQLGERGAFVVDAPVSGGVARAASGDLLIMASGQPSHLERARPMLTALSSTLAIAGPNPGDGQRLKLVNQLLCGVHIAVAGEALAFAKSIGVDPAFALATLEAGAAASFMLSDRGPRMLEDTPVVRSAIDIFVKDLTLVAQAAAANGAAIPLTAAGLELFTRASALGMGREDDSTVIRVLEGKEQ